MMDPTGTALAIKEMLLSGFPVDVQAILADGDGKMEKSSQSSEN